MKHTHYALAYYCIAKVEDPKKEVIDHKKYFKDRDIKGRIYISKEGINGQVSATIEEAKEYETWMREHPVFHDVKIKLHELEEHIFDRLTVKEKKQLVAVDIPIDFSSVAEHITPERWREMLENKDENTLVIDVRNDYEGVIGHFEGAVIPPCKTFREFPDYIKELKKSYDPTKTKVMMYCTGGIRCEFFSPFMKQNGFENLYQLDGGVIGYGLKEGQKHWKGKLFVFDDRLAIPISNEEAAPISKCMLCDTDNDRYINCANMDCNKLFICCDSCIDTHNGCCSKECLEQGRVRDYNHEEYPKPFRRMAHDKKKEL